MLYNQNIWARFYKKIYAIRKELKDARDQPRIIDYEQRLAMEKQADILCQQCSEYLDSCGMRIPDALWVYNKDDKRTWKSEKDFSFHHLVA